MDKNLVIGLTGQTGAGKSTVAKWFVKHGFVLIDADLCAREVVKKGSPCLQQIVEAFGNHILNPDQSLNRPALGQIVFSDPQKLQQLNSIMNSYIIELIQEKINANSGSKILLDAPTLFESGANQLCDKTICVTAQQDLRLERIIERDKLDPQRALDRIHAQHDDDYYLSRCDYALTNNTTSAQLELDAEQLIQTILESGAEE